MERVVLGVNVCGKRVGLGVEVQGLVIMVEEEGCGQAHKFGKWAIEGMELGLLSLTGWWRAVTIGMGGFGRGSG